MFLPKVYFWELLFPKNGDYFPKRVFLETFLPKTVILFPKIVFFMLFILGLLSLFPLKPFIYADSDILPFFPKNTVKENHYVRHHSSLSCFLQFPLSTSLSSRFSIYAPKSTKKRALNLLCRFKTLSFIDYFFLQKTE